jgi:hypothetical protein
MLRECQKEGWILTGYMHLPSTILIPLSRKVKEYLKVYILQSYIQNVGPCDCVIHGVALLAGQGADSIFQRDLVAMLGAPGKGRK